MTHPPIAKFKQNAFIRTTRELKTTSFFKRGLTDMMVEVLEEAVADNGQMVTKIRTEDGTTGWTDAANLDLHRAGDQE